MNRELLARAWRFTWQNPALLFLGGLAAAGRELDRLVDTISFQARFLQNPQQAAAELQRLLSRPEALIAGLSLLAALLLLVWLTGALAEGGLIDLTGRLAGGEPSPPIGAGVRAGRRWLWPLVLLDTAVFFPLFLIALLALLIASGTIISLALNAAEIQAEGLPVGRLAAAAACLIPLLLALPPAMLFTALWRVIAFRAHIIGRLPLRESLRAIAPILRRHTGKLLGTFLLTLLVWLAAGQAADFPAALLPRLSLPHPLSAGLAYLAALLLHAPAITFNGVLWTLVFVEFENQAKIDRL